MQLPYIIIATSIISIGALLGLITLYIAHDKLNKYLLHLIALSAGTLMGGAFLHLLPEAAEQFTNTNYLTITLLSFIGFHLIEKILHWRHCHDGICEVHTFGHMNLIGDSIHNFIDGLIIAAAFLTDLKLGIITSLAIALHEIPQEISDFGVLIYAGYSKQKALVLNLLVATTVIAGGIVGYYIGKSLEMVITSLLPIAAGGFIYIATADLMPELGKEKRLSKSVMLFTTFLLGVFLMYLLKLVEM